MIEAIRSYMDDQITAFQFDEMLTEIGCETEDKTVRSVRHACGFIMTTAKTTMLWHPSKCGTSSTAPSCCLHPMPKFRL